MQLRVDRDRNKARAPRSEQAREELGAIGHRDPDAISHPEVVTTQQGTGNSGDLVLQFRVREGTVVRGYRRTTGNRACYGAEDVGQVHIR